MISNELQAKIDKSIERLKAFEPPEGYYLAFSGGKDSVVCKALCDMAGVKYDAVYRVTSVDPPELVRFIKDQHPDVRREVPRDKDGKPITMWSLIPKKKMLPTRLVRYCCQQLKESGGDGRITITGVRWAESTNRKHNQGMVTVMAAGKNIDSYFAGQDDFLKTKRGGYILVNDNDDSRRLVESCYKRRKTTVNPIIDWSDRDVWDFIKENNIPYCSLYDEGFSRIGCIGCPMASIKGREAEFKRWPKYKDAYFRAIEQMQKARELKGLPLFLADKLDTVPTTQDIFNWWMGYDVLPGQIDFFEEVDDES